MKQRDEVDHHRSTDNLNGGEGVGNQTRASKLAEVKLFPAPGESRSSERQNEEVERLKGELHAASATRRKLELELEAHRLAREDLEASNQELERENELLSESIQRRFAELATMTRSIEELRSVQEERDKEAARLRDERDDLLATLSEVSDQLHQTGMEYTHAAAELVSLRMRLVSVQSQMLSQRFRTLGGGVVRLASVLRFRDRKRVQIQRRVRAIRRSGVFDEGWYLETYPDVANGKIEAAEHFLRFGAAEGRLPCRHFPLLSPSDAANPLLKILGQKA